MRTLALLLALSATVWAQTAKPSAATVSTTVGAHGGTAILLSVGTPLYMTLDTAMTTGANMVGDLFLAHISRPVVRNGQTIIPQGAGVEGTVTNISEPRRITGKPSIMLRPETLVLPNGQRWPLHAVVVDTTLYPVLDVDEEGAIHGKGRDSDDWKHTGVGAGGGAVIGAFAGPAGALAGAAIGTTASTVHWLAKRRSVEVPAGTELILELSRPLEQGTILARE